jgi:hypothetical protein
MIELAQHDAHTCFRALAARGSVDGGLRIIDKLNAERQQLAPALIPCPMGDRQRPFPCHFPVPRWRARKTIHEAALNNIGLAAGRGPSLLSCTRFHCRFPHIREMADAGSQQTPCTAKTKEARLVRAFFVLMLNRGLKPSIIDKRRFGHAPAHPEDSGPGLTSDNPSLRQFSTNCYCWLFQTGPDPRKAQTFRDLAQLRAARYGLRRPSGPADSRQPCHSSLLGSFRVPIQLHQSCTRPNASRHPVVASARHVAPFNYGR